MRDKEKNFISAVIYVHNAESSILGFLEMIIRILEENFAHSEIICVNDASDDGSLAQIRKACECTGGVLGVSVINMSHFYGRELAMHAGVDLSIGDFVFEFDNAYSDFVDSTVMDVYWRALEGYDIVNASPDRREKLESRLFYRAFDRFAELSYGMSTESFRILSRRAINRVGSMNKAVVNRKVVYANCGLKMDSLKYLAKQEQWKTPAFGRREKSYRFCLAVDSLILFTQVGWCFSMAMTVAMMLLALSVFMYTVAAYFTLHPVEGWTTTILFLSVCFFGLFGIQTIIIKYLQLLVDMVFRRKHYSFESIEKLTR